MSDVKLFNKGQRDIVIDGGVINPQQAVSVEKEVAEKLLALFAGELIDIEADAKAVKAEKKIETKKANTAKKDDK